MPKKKTQLQLDYEKEYKRLVKGFSKYQKQGYIFPEQTVIKNPTRVTQKMLQSIKDIKPKALTFVAEQIDIDTGEVLNNEVKVSLKELKQVPTGLKKTPTVETKKAVKEKKSPTKRKSHQKQKAKISKTVAKPITETTPAQETNETTNYIPVMSIVDAIADAIKELPDVTLTGKGVQIAARRNALLDLLYDNLYSAEDEEAYIQYLHDNQAEIFHGLEAIKYDSKEERVDASFANLGRILNAGNALSASQAESISSMQEMFYST